MDYLKASKEDQLKLLQEGSPDGIAEAYRPLAVSVVSKYILPEFVDGMVDLMFPRVLVVAEVKYLERDRDSKFSTYLAYFLKREVEKRVGYEEV